MTAVISVLREFSVINLICGLDEAGRGPLAGPVAAGAVILPDDFPVHILNDSKCLSEKKRRAAEALIKASACWGVGLVSHEIIDTINILQASLLAMRRAAETLFFKLPVYLARHARAGQLLTCSDVCIQAIADGNKSAGITHAAYTVINTAIVKADAAVPAVMAAAILAKNERDRIMRAYALQYPEYGYDRHKGYPTAAHRAVCRKLGPSPIQRRSFRY